jgi:signal transduction histidine kinase
MRQASAIVSSALTHEEVDRMLGEAVVGLAALFEADGVVAALPDGAGFLELVGSHGYDDSSHLHLESRRGLLGAAFTSGEPVLVADVTRDPRYVEWLPGMRSGVMVPLKAGGRTLGALGLETGKRSYDETDLTVLLPLADQIGAVIADRRERARVGEIERTALGRLQEADQLKEDFIATVSHELRTPLTSIKGYASTLIRREADLTQEERNSFLEVMVRQCDRLAQIIDTLLLVSRLEAGDIEGRRAYIGLTDLLRDAAEASTDEERFEIEVEGTIGLTSDHFRVFHIVRNLMENACKYSPSSTKVLVTAKRSDRSFEVTVQDQGRGIPEPERERIFDRFSRLPDPEGTVRSGTGLGLYIARRFARELGGDIEVTEGPGAPWTGARFVLRLPPEVVETQPGHEVAPKSG